MPWVGLNLNPWFTPTLSLTYTLHIGLMYTLTCTHLLTGYSSARSHAQGLATTAS